MSKACRRIEAHQDNKENSEFAVFLHFITFLCLNEACQENFLIYACFITSFPILQKLEEFASKKPYFQRFLLDFTKILCYNIKRQKDFAYIYS